MLLVSRCPLRVSLVGGGTDVPSVSEKLPDGGRSVGFSLNWSMTLVGHSFYQGLRLKYSEVEDVVDPTQIRHAVAREVLSRLCPELSAFEIASLCDVMGGTGLGSSAAFTVALIGLVARLKAQTMSRREIAAKACEAEIEWCRRPVGLQDPYLCALGGMNALSFHGFTPPTISQVSFDDAWTTKQASPFVLVRVDGVHDSGLRLENAISKLRAYAPLPALVGPAVAAIESGDVRLLAEVVRESWQLKKAALPDEKNRIVDELLKLARELDRRAGGKLLGSGGGGYVLIVSERAGLIAKTLGDRARRVTVNHAPAETVMMWASDSPGPIVCEAASCAAEAERARRT